MKKAVVCMIVLPVMLVLWSGAGVAQDAVADLQKGWQNLDVKLLQKTVAAFEEQAKKNPKDHLAPYYAARAHFAIADCLDINSSTEFDTTGEGDKHIDTALALLQTSLGLKEDNADAHILKYHILRRKMFHVSFPALMMHIADRRAAHARANELAPGTLPIKLMNALEVAEGGWPPPEPETPVAEFEKIIKEYPQASHAYYHIGEIWDKAKKTGEAKKYYQKALEIDKHHHWARKKLKALEN